MEEKEEYHTSQEAGRPLLPQAFAYGALTAVALLGYFLLMGLFGLHHIIELRFLNGLIITIGICWAISQYKIHNNSYIRYLDGLGLGALTAAVAALLFAICMGLYVSLFDETFLTTLRARQFFGEGLSVLVLMSVIILEGVISGFMVAFIAMQYFKSEKRSPLPASKVQLPADHSGLPGNRK
jgi:hypothetical protein